MRREGLVIGVVGESSLEVQELMTLLGGGPPVSEVVRMGPSTSWGSPEEMEAFHQDPTVEPLAPFDPGRLSNCDAVILARAGDEVRAEVIGGAAWDGPWVLDMAPEGEGSWADPDGNLGALRETGAHLRLPDAGARLAALVGRAAEPFGPSAFTAHRFLPASLYGEAGVRDLHAQASDLLRFHPVKPGVLPGQVAFNLWPLEDPTGGLLWCNQVAALWPRAPGGASASFLASTFHGAGLSLALSFERPAEAAREAIRKAFGDHPIIRFADSDATPVDAASADRALLGCRAAESWLWAWLAYDNVKVGRAAMAAKVLATLAGT